MKTKNKQNLQESISSGRTRKTVRAGNIRYKRKEKGMLTNSCATERDEDEKGEGAEADDEAEGEIHPRITEASWRSSTANMRARSFRGWV